MEVGDQVVSSAQFLLDSESSIHSDFNRMSHNSTDNIQDQQPETAQVEGLINHINMQTRVANISRGAIEKWGRAPATMDFVFADDLRLDELQQGGKIHFTFEIQNGDFVITDYESYKQEHNDD